MKKIVAVIGPSEPSPSVYETSVKLGEILGSKGFVIATGGGKGVMEGVMKGAKKRKALTIGFLPSSNKQDANPYTDIVLATGMGVMRNYLLISCADIVIVCGISSGTLTELTMALHLKKRVLGIEIPPNLALPTSFPIFNSLNELQKSITS